jgi:DNA polymerase III alpha subunit
VESFAGYSFSKAHSASFAVESYQSLYLKAHFPLEFIVAVINNFGGFYQTWVYVTEAKKNGARIHLPCVNGGSYLTAITGTDIYLGLVHVQHLETQLGQRIEEERILNGHYRSLENFVHRLQPALEQLLVLIRIGAFRFTGRAKKELLWEAHMLLSNKVHLPSPAALLQAPARTFVLPRLAHSVLEDAYDELELLGFPVTLSYFDLLKTSFRGEVPARELMGYLGRRVRVAGMLVTTKYVRTKRGEIMHFATFLDPHNDFFDTVHFPQSLKAWPFQGSGVYLILGKVVEEFGFPSIEVEKMARLPFQEDPRY